MQARMLVKRTYCQPSGDKCKKSSFLSEKKIMWLTLLFSLIFLEMTMKVIELLGMQTWQYLQKLTVPWFLTPAWSSVSAIDLAVSSEANCIGFWLQAWSSVLVIACLIHSSPHKDVGSIYLSLSHKQKLIVQIYCLKSHDY